MNDHARATKHRTVRAAAIGFAAGTALSALVFTTVGGHTRYEAKGSSGKVDLEAEDRTAARVQVQEPTIAPTTATPGGNANKEDSRARATTTATATTIVELQRQVEAQRREIAQLRAAVPGAAQPSRETSLSGFVDVPQEELAARAQRCELRYDHPRLFAGDAPTARELGDPTKFSDTERQQVDEVLATAHKEASAAMRALYIEMGGDARQAANMTADAMFIEIGGKAAPGSENAARARLARERAGLATPGPAATQSVFERALRLEMNAGDDVEKRLAERLGAARAHDLRKEHGGWSARQMSSGCD